ncbi:MAG: NADH-quinone oxidoreductase subunit J [Nitrospira sp.]|nr:NADH-quinone oxidoreductase subunit J [bacterium]MBL7048512.1 NADH-quinone oxidoreductase subunit J [Nitrospira sp.]
MTLVQGFFIYFAVAMTVLALLVVTRKSPMHSVLWMLAFFFHTAGLYLFLNAEFLAAAQIIVYAGAIMVLFIFVIMLLNLKKEETERKLQKHWVAGLVVSLVLMAAMVKILSGITVLPPLGEYSIQFVQLQGNLMTIGKVLYTQYLLPFEIASVVLLVAIIGAVVLAKKRIL